MKNLKINSFGLYSIFVLTLSTLGCSNDSYEIATSPAPTSASQGVGSTTPACGLQSVARPVKLMFVVDRSGSNAEPTMNGGVDTCDPSIETCAPATDPTLAFRSGSITQFFNDYSNKTNFSWGFITFSNSNAQSYISSGGIPSFGTSASMQSAITQFNSGTDDGGTPYLAALSLAQTAVANDPDIDSTSAASPLYYVIFLSDGYPTDALNADGSVDLPELNSQILSLIALAPGRVILSTIYYGTIDDPKAAATLQAMAQTGGGNFVNVDTSSTISMEIGQVIQVPASDCQ